MAYHKEELAKLQAAENAERKAKAEAVKPRYQFFIAPVKNENWDKIYDDSVVKYRIEGIIKNMSELEAVGKGNALSGGMTYLFNKLSGQFIMAVGGGSLYVSRERHPEYLASVAAFIHLNPGGGDITEIVEQYRVQS
jgi:hypothetical protein